jgi:glycosyltransferase involved in cell wall biosynthesis
MIIVDDGSTDGTVKVVTPYLQKDNRIVLFQQSNKGSAAARNVGIKNAKGRYIALLDADDLWNVDFLESQIAFMQSKSALVVFSSYEKMDENSNSILSPVIAKSEVSYKQMQKMDYIPCLTGLYDTDKFGKVYLKEEFGSIRDDYAYWLDILKLVEKAYGNPQVLARYRVSRNSITGNKMKLIKHQFLFHYKYQKFGLLRSIYNTCYWIVSGIIKFSK